MPAMNEGTMTAKLKQIIIIDTNECVSTINNFDRTRVVPNYLVHSHIVRSFMERLASLDSLPHQ